MMHDKGTSRHRRAEVKRQNALDTTSCQTADALPNLSIWRVVQSASIYTAPGPVGVSVCSLQLGLLCRINSQVADEACQIARRRRSTEAAVLVVSALLLW